ncbi:MAG: cytochrome c oxidase subunit 3 [Salibacter sp.]|uniref:cytochrome c oxidase subunit 3 n=1 Tax=Salibacter sp. TaxID=2010995 RepID=UPI00287070BB|nr:cytochrome c oxidase subunit 3 [Salibacter sp.]MDR9397997.1 cytochrome c oxidase subunit 3 [Salibacter sp.]
MEYSEYAGEIEDQEKKETRRKSAKPLLWVGMVGVLMAFAGLTSAYLIRHSDSDWVSFELPDSFFISTASILLSSIALILSKRAVKKGNLSQVKQFVGLSLIFGLGFVVAQFYSYGVLVENGHYFTGSNISSSFLYVLTGFHLAHVISGIIVLIVLLVRSLMEKYTAEEHLGLSLGATYWHFLDVLWIYLLLFLLFIR